MKNRAGTFVNNLSGEMAYRSFRPADLPPNPPITISDALLAKLIEANQQIAFLDGLSARIPSMKLFVSMYIRKEALLSSQIEGTQCTLDDILNPFLDENVNRDVSDVINYIKATEYALQRLQEMPLCNRLIREIHKVVLSDTRGAEKNPGEFRYSQNWIGGQGSTLRTARYIPPNPENMHEAISQLEKYIHAEDSLNPLIQAALIHYQFETIHPFLDGNGRIGRLLITLFLMEKNVLSTPALYISYYLKLNRVEYYDRMTEVRRTGDYEQWIFFFLQAFTDSARDAITAIDQLTALHQESVNTINSFTQRQQKNLLKLLSYLEAHPIIDISQTADALDLSYNTVAKSITTLMDKGLLQQTAKNGKARIFSYTKYLEILRKDT